MEVGLEDGVARGALFVVAHVVHEASDHPELVADVHRHPFEHSLGVPRTRRHGSILTRTAVPALACPDLVSDVVGLVFRVAAPT